MMRTCLLVCLSVCLSATGPALAQASEGSGLRLPATWLQISGTDAYGPDGDAHGVELTSLSGSSRHPTYFSAGIRSTPQAWAVPWQTESQSRHFHGRLGMGWLITPGLLLVPFTEMGHASWQKSGSTNGPSQGVDYYGVGTLVQYQLAPHWQLTGSALLGRNQGNAAPGNDALNGSVPLYRLGVGVDYQLNDRLHGSLGIDYRYSRLGMPGFSTMPPQSQESSPGAASISLGLGLSF
ncbi:hypothetical protein THUN1379_10640 [Paludibacterium sp. THUN1379]|uniref:outer membrane protein n=1 Tax=Paludibacterium sp. THUN1379 TaxID=3112107 RepID=UPI00308F443C|nr:hypothetical protein THUN1379_10640 [Paludibacterium sp. THUN1379]